MRKTAAFLVVLALCAAIAPAEAKRRDSCVWFGVTLCG